MMVSSLPCYVYVPPGVWAHFVGIRQQRLTCDRPGGQASYSSPSNMPVLSTTANFNLTLLIIPNICKLSCSLLGKESASSCMTWKSCYQLAKM